MRILLDECVPARLQRSLATHSVSTVAREGWSGKKNGELLALLLQAGFEALITVDHGIRYQQNLRAGQAAVVVLRAASNQLSDLLPLVPGVLTALETIRPGEVIEVRS